MSTTIAQRPSARFPGKATAGALAGLALAAGIGFVVRTNTADSPATEAAIQHTTIEQVQKSGSGVAVGEASEVAGFAHYRLEQILKSAPPAETSSATLTDRAAFKYNVLEEAAVSQTQSAGVLEQASPGLMEGTG